MAESSQQNLVASAGKIHLLDLGALKERLGPKWDRMAQHVQMFFEAAIRRSLRPGDTFCRFEELGYLVMFRELSAAEAELKCASISEEVCKRLFGENGEQVSLRNLVAHVGLTTVPSGAEGNAALNTLLERTGKEVVIKSGGGAKLRVQREEPTFRLRVGGVPLSRQRIPASEISFVYRPIWDSVNGVVLTYLCQPTFAQAGIAPSSGFCTTEDEADQSSLDLYVLRECLERSSRLRAEGLRVILAVPVHFMTVARPRSWRDYSQLFREVSREVARDTAFIVFGIDHGVPHIRLAQELPKLSRIAFRVLCTIDRSQGANARFAKTGAHGVGTAVDEGEDELLSIARVKEVAKETQAAAIDSFVLGLRTTSLTLTSISSGIRYLEGPVVRPAVSDPRHGFAQNVEDLYKTKRQLA